MTAATTSTDNRRTFWDISTVASRLGVETRHVRRLVSERRIPFINWGRLLRFDPAESRRGSMRRGVPPPPVACRMLSHETAIPGNMLMPKPLRPECC